ncbi:MAG: hypothetical protein AB7N80_14810 [Bdellovibrionales bacterium]
MQKLILLLVLNLVSVAAHAMVVETCHFMIQVDEISSRGEILVEEIAQNQRLGTLKFDGELRLSSDEIEVIEYSRGELAQLNQDTGVMSLAQILDVSLKGVDSAKAVFIDREGLADDATGVVVISLFDRAKQQLIKITQAGWSAGICEN